MKRTFIAIKMPVSKQTAELIKDIKLELSDEKIKWVEIDQMHITIFFAGDTHLNMIEKISLQLDNLLKAKKSFKISCKGLGLFKNLAKPRVLFLGIEHPESLQNLKKDIDGLMKELGFDIEERTFKPHLTLGRIKYIKHKSKLKTLLEKYKDFEFGSFNIDKVLFYESELTSKGPVYKVIKHFYLD